MSLPIALNLGGYLWTLLFVIVLCVLYHRTFTLLNPPILFGPQHTYSTRCPPTFANTVRCRLSRTQSFFRYQNAKWWNEFELPEPIVAACDFSSSLYNYLLYG